jgi:hypothetical protein
MIAMAVKMREFVPYTVILILPGGSLMALLLWLYRRQKRAAGPGAQLSSWASPMRSPSGPRM